MDYMNLLYNSKFTSRTGLPSPQGGTRPVGQESSRTKKEDEICTSSLSSSTSPLTSGIEEAPQLLLSVILLYHIFVAGRKPLSARPFFGLLGPAIHTNSCAVIGKKKPLLIGGSSFSRTAVAKGLLGTSDQSD